VDQKARVAFALCSQHHRLQRSMGHVFAKAISRRVVDAHDDQRSYSVLANHPICGLVDLPLHSGKSRSTVKQVLPVVQIENRISAGFILRIVVARRQPHPQPALVPKDVAGKFMQPQVAGYGVVALDA